MSKSLFLETLGSLLRLHSPDSTPSDSGVIYLTIGNKVITTKDWTYFFLNDKLVSSTAQTKIVLNL